MSSLSDWNAANLGAQSVALNGLIGHLAAITSATENTFLETLIDPGQSIWLGGSGTGAGASWSWEYGIEAGTEFSVGSTASHNMYNAWLAGEPNDGSGNTVYVRLREGTSDWTDRPDTDTYHYVIEWEAGLMGDDGAADVLSGGTGDDQLYGYEGNDTLNGGDGLDVLYGMDDDDTLNGGNGADTLFGGLGDDVVNGDADSDIIYGDNQADNVLIMEAGRLSVSQANATEWHSVSFSGIITDAVIKMFAEDVTGDPFTLRVRNVTDNGFEFQLDEYDYQDGSTGLESLSWMAVSSGDHVLANGLSIQAGYTSATNESSTSVSFLSSIINPVVFSQVSSDNELSAVVTRNSNVTAGGFTVQMQEEEANSSSHATEDIGWIAIESGGSVGSGILAGTTGDNVTHSTSTINFGGTFAAAPIFLADMQTLDGGDTAVTAGATSVTTTQAQVYIDEEESNDTETNHTNENVGYIVLESGVYQASQFVNGSDVLHGGDGDDIIYADGSNLVVNQYGSSLSQAMIADNPVAYWQLNETSGTSALNIGSTGGVDGTYTNGPTLGAAALYLGGASSVDFDGVDDYVAIPDSADINTSAQAERTVELVFNADATAARQVLWEEGGGTNCIVMYIEGGELYVNARDSGEYGPFTIKTAISAGQTYHAALVFDSVAANTFTGYLNGVSFGSGATPTDMDSHGGDVGIGAMNDGGYFHDGAQGGTNYFFDGRISDVGIYNRALSSAEIQEHADIVQGLLPGAAPTIDDMLYGGDGLDVLYGGDGRDAFIFESSSAFNDVDQIMNFSYSERDALDISDLLTGFTAGVDDINDFVQLTESAGDTFVAIDANGAAGGASFTDVAQIIDFTGLNADYMLSSGHLIT
ncbi:MAG TPA: type I secretion C-terminal target domain-containing protein [Micavibrio sp.]|nr:type I secretion C-terminal target domain-containing protein [Micavibrio sp.]